MYLHKELETLTRPEIEKLQLERLQKTVRHCMNSPFYKQRFAENHLSPEDIRSLDDLQKIPFTTKQDLRDTYPFGLASVPLEKTVRLHSSSGTTGNPTVILHTQKDLDEWANAVARCLYMVGLRPGDIFQNSSGYGMFTGGLGFQYGAERAGNADCTCRCRKHQTPVEIHLRFRNHRLARHSQLRSPYVRGNAGNGD